MTDFETLFAKVQSLKAEVCKDSISPQRLGYILERLLELWQSGYVSGCEAILNGLASQIASAASDLRTLRRDHSFDVGLIQDRITAILSLLEEVDLHIKANADAIANIDDYIIPQEIQPQIDYNRHFIDRINDSVGSCTRTVTDAYGTVTVPGIAPLNEEGKIEARFLPSFVDDAMDFDGWAPDIDELETWFAGDAGSSETRLLFWRSEGTFVLEVTPVSSTGKPQTPVYYAGWEKTEDQKLCLGRAGATGYYPLKSKTYYCPATNKSYRWTGGSLAPTGSDLDLGDGANMAFPGDRGKALEEQKADRTELATRFKPLAESDAVVMGSTVTLRTDLKLMFSNEFDGMVNIPSDPLYIGQRIILCDYRSSIYSTEDPAGVRLKVIGNGNSLIYGARANGETSPVFACSSLTFRSGVVELIAIPDDPQVPYAQQPKIGKCRWYLLTAQADYLNYTKIGENV